MAVRTSFTAGEVLAAADLTDTFAAKLNLAGGKVLQVVRATDTTNRATTSTSFVDVTGMSVTITPQKSTSRILILAIFSYDTTSTGTAPYGRVRITDSSNNNISGAEDMYVGLNAAPTNINTLLPVTLIGYATPATTSATTYKLRQATVGLASVTVANATNTGQMYAIEVSA